MKKLMTLLVLVALANSTQAQEFITRWDLNNTGSSPNAITFGVGTTGTVNYTWETIPAGTTGGGSFSGTTATITGLPTGATIRLHIDTTHFNRIKIGNGTDRERLMDVEQWGATHWTSMDSAFFGSVNLNISATDVPDLSTVSTMYRMFKKCTSLNSPANINSWNTSSVTNMAELFANASSFNQPIGNWNTSNVLYMIFMFYYAQNFNQPIGNWNTGNVLYMNSMFQSAQNFNQPIGNWDVSNVLEMSRMFEHATNFNQPIGNWNVGNGTSFESMFVFATSFNQPIGNWNTQNVVYMSAMFSFATAFNQPIDNWNTSNVIAMNAMFSYASAFNQPISNWDISNVSAIQKMFEKATNFNQSLANWNLSSMAGSLGNMHNMFDSSGIDCFNYSATLQGWANNPNTPSLLQLGAAGLHYGNQTIPSRNYLINTKNWTFLGDIYNNNFCCMPIQTSINQTECGSYYFNNQTLTASGIYYDTLLNVYSCDSIVALTLTINNANAAATQNGTQLTATATGATYQWLTCNPYTIIAGATNQTYTATTNGDYAVVVTQNGCTDTSNCITVNSVGINEVNSQNLLTVSPNPTHSIFEIKGASNGAIVTLYNTFGQKLLTSKIENQTPVINISAFAKGIYFVEVKQENTSSRVKISKE